MTVSCEFRRKGREKRERERERGRQRERDFQIQFFFGKSFYINIPSFLYILSELFFLISKPKIHFENLRFVEAVSFEFRVRHHISNSNERAAESITHTHTHIIIIDRSTPSSSSSKIIE